MKLSYPRQVVVVSCRGEVKDRFSVDKKTKDNLITLSWHSPVSFEPLLYAIMIGKTRYSYQLIKKSKVFCVNFMPKELQKEVVFIGTHSGENIDKFQEAKLEKEEAESIDCPRLKQADGVFECEVINELEAGDHVIFIGKILKIVKNKNSKRIFQDIDGFTTTR